MYSYEDRIRAVKLYIKLGKRTVATIRQLGYPTKNALKVWHREYELGCDLRVGYVRLRQKYSDAQKQAAVDYYLKHDRCLAGTVKALGYPCCETLSGWIEERHPEVHHRVIGKGVGVQHSPAFKKAAVIALCTKQITAQAIAQTLTVSRPTLYNWKNQLLGRDASPFMKHHDDSPPDSEQTELQRQVESLQRNIRQLQLEHDLLKKANELLKKGLGVDLPLLTNREKTLLVDALKETYSLSELCVELDLARSSYFYHRASLRRPDKYADARLAITEVLNAITVATAIGGCVRHLAGGRCSSRRKSCNA